jgi:hypothetical protein
MKAATLAVEGGRSACASDRLRLLLLVRMAGTQGGLTRSVLAQDLAPIVPQTLPGAQWRALIERELEALLRDGLAIEEGVQLRLSDPGSAAVRRFLGIKGALPTSWSELREQRLIAKALGLERLGAKHVKALSRPDGLRAGLVQATYNLKLKGIATPSRLRSALAALALKRAFGNQISVGVTGKGGLSAKAGRLLAAQLLRNPRDFGTDSRLVAALAAEHSGTKSADLEALRRAILARFFAGALVAADLRRPPPAGVLEGPAPAPLRAAPANARPARPDLAGFVGEVHRQAAAHAQGWVGNRKAYISHVWRALGQACADWRLSEIEFKCMLLEAHRAGQLALVNADLKDHKSLKDVQESAVVYKNAVFHFVRVDG